MLTFQMKNFRDRQRNSIVNVPTQIQEEPAVVPPSRQLAPSPILEEDSEDALSDSQEKPPPQRRSRAGSVKQIEPLHINTQTETFSNRKVLPHSSPCASPEDVRDASYALRKSRRRMSGFASNVGYITEALHQIPEQADESPDESTNTTYTSDTRRTSNASTSTSTSVPDSPTYATDRKTALSALEGRSRRSPSPISEIDFASQILQRQSDQHFVPSRSSMNVGHNRQSSLSTRKMIALPSLHERRSTMDFNNHRMSQDSRSSTSSPVAPRSGRLRSFTLSADKEEAPRTAPLPARSPHSRTMSSAMSPPISAPQLHNRPAPHGRSPSVPHFPRPLSLAGSIGPQTPRHFFISPTTTHPDSTNLEFSEIQEENEKLSSELLRLRRDLSSLAERSSKEYMALEATLHAERSRWEEMEADLKERNANLERSRDVLVQQHQQAESHVADNSSRLVEENDRLAAELAAMKRTFEAQAHEWEAERNEWQRGIAEGRIRILSDSDLRDAEIQTEAESQAEAEMMDYFGPESYPLSRSRSTDGMSANTSTTGEYSFGVAPQSSASSEDEDIAPLREMPSKAFGNRMYSKARPRDEMVRSPTSPTPPSPVSAAPQSRELQDQVAQLRGQLGSLRREMRAQVRAVEDENSLLRRESERQRELVRLTGGASNVNSSVSQAKQAQSTSSTHSASASLSDVASFAKRATRHANRLSLAGLSGFVGHVIGADPRPARASEEQVSPLPTPTISITSPISEADEDELSDTMSPISPITKAPQWPTMPARSPSPSRSNAFEKNYLRSHGSLIAAPPYSLDFTQSCKECLDEGLLVL